MTLWEIVQITGGTFTAGTDWSAQFDDETASGYLRTWQASAAGELRLPYSSAARRARLALSCEQPFELHAWIENNGGGATGVQVHVDGVRQEFTSGSAVSASLTPPGALLAIILSEGQLEFAAAFLSGEIDGVPAESYPLTGTGTGAPGTSGLSGAI